MVSLTFLKEIKLMYLRNQHSFFYEKNSFFIRLVIYHV